MKTVAIGLSALVIAMLIVPAPAAGTCWECVHDECEVADSGHSGKTECQSISTCFEWPCSHTCSEIGQSCQGVDCEETPGDDECIDNRVQVVPNGETFETFSWQAPRPIHESASCLAG